jgi:hypothetical protein
MAVAGAAGQLHLRPSERVRLTLGDAKKTGEGPVFIARITFRPALRRRRLTHITLAARAR